MILKIKSRLEKFFLGHVFCAVTKQTLPYIQTVLI